VGLILTLARFKPHNLDIFMQETEVMKTLIACYSQQGHTHLLAESIAKGASEVRDAVVEVKRIPEILSHNEIERKGASEFQKIFSKIPICTLEDLAESDSIFLGAPTYLGNMCAQMQQFLSSLGRLWREDALVGKVGSAFTSSASQHGGQEAALLHVHATMFHLGMIVVGLPYTFKGQKRIDEITGGTPYGVTTISGQRGERKPSQNELEAARFQGRHVAKIGSKLCRK
jgi:NAD(P)H dehydrogenase (quinone)